MTTATTQMSGWYGNQRGGRSGRGSGMGRGRSTPSEIHTNKTVKDCLFYLGSSNKASDYEITADIFCQYHQKFIQYRQQCLRSIEKDGKIRHRRLEANSKY